MKCYMGIDPGKSGGVAICYENNISAHKCPETEGDMYSLLEIMASAKDFEEIVVSLEHVWGFPSDSSKTAFTFGKNFGAWITCLQIKELDYTLVTPRKWQYDFRVEKGMQKSERKRYLKTIAEQYVKKSEEPFRVTYSTADAILIAIYTMKQLETLDT
tara:strand:+ start:17567 stop:18040 length:474 start_codon:yes stop_codon:yes gene_type:complete